MGSSRKRNKESRKRRHRSKSPRTKQDRSVVVVDRTITLSSSSSHDTSSRHGRGRSRDKDRERQTSAIDQSHRSSKRACRSSVYNEHQQQDDIDEDASFSSRSKTSGGGGSGGGGGGGSGGGDLSLSISETNKLRAKLGLKPLESKDGSSSVMKTEISGGDTMKDEFVHKPAESLTDKRFVEKMREKLSVQKHKREIMQKLSKVKGIADSDSEDDDACNWIQKSRQIEHEKRQAEQRAKLLEEMDAEFGIGNLVEDEFKKIKGDSYSAKDLRGLTVQHAQASFTEGKLTVLTLKDKGVLDEDNDDVLVNVNIVDDEKAAKNVEIRKGKPTYNPYDDDDIDDYGRVIDKSLLSKYDEEIDGEVKKSFTIGSSGTVKTESERDLIRQKLLQKQGQVSLDMPALKIANEYYTDEEMLKFKKPSKFRKVRRKVKPLKADELLGMSANSTAQKASNSDLGSRGQRNYRHNSPPPLKFKHPWENDMDLDDDDDAEIIESEEDFTGIPAEPDEAELELQFALNKARKLKQQEERARTGSDRIIANMNAAKASNAHIRIKSETIGEDEEDGEEETEKGSIVLNSTAEFCRALGDIPTYGMSGNRDEDVDELMDAELYDEDKIKDEDSDGDIRDNDGGNDGWSEVKVNSNPSTKIKKEDVTILDEEPDVGTGIAGALQLAMKKGYLEQEIKKVTSAPRHTNLEAASYTIEDKNFMEDDRQGRRERYATGPVTDFRDKDGYRPDVKLEYIDDGGRLLTPKEAFRYLSHKFHGKGSGKNKTEKRMKKVQEESLMRQMSSTDTPLGTLALLQDKQKQTQSPYIVLSGGSKAINPSIISKTK